MADLGIFSRGGKGGARVFGRGATSIFILEYNITLFLFHLLSQCIFQLIQRGFNVKYELRTARFACLLFCYGLELWREIGLSAWERDQQYRE